MKDCEGMGLTDRINVFDKKYVGGGLCEADNS